jgi:VCBS repeat-containing protein
VNDAPVAVNDSFTTNEDTALNVGAPGVLGNDTDIDSAMLTAALVTGPAHGTLTLNSDGSFNYAPVANYVGTDSFSYQASDGSLDSNVATVSLTIKPASPEPKFTIGNYTIVSSTRIDRTHFEYTMTAEIANIGLSAEGVKAVVTSTSPASVIVENTIIFGNVAAGQTLTSTDTFTFIQDRTVPFDPSAFVWSFVVDRLIP